MILFYIFENCVYLLDKLAVLWTVIP